MIVNPEGPPLTLAERKARFWFRVWSTVDVVVPALAVVMSPFSVGMVARHGLTAAVIAFLVVTFALWVVAFLRLADVGPGARTHR